MKWSDVPKIVGLAFKEYGRDHVSTLGAALAYFAVFSLGPLLILAVTIAGAIFGEAAARGEVMNTVSNYMGEEGAKAVQSLLENARRPDATLFATIVGVVALIFGAMGIFGQLKIALNMIWEVPPPEGGGIFSLIFTNLLNLLMVLVFIAVLLLSLMANAGLTALSKLIGDQLVGSPLLLQIASYVTTIAVLTVI